MEEEIDLRRYVYVALKYKYWLIGLPLLVGLATYLFFALRPAVYESKSSLAMLRVRSEVAFEPKFKTVADGDTDSTIHRATLLALATSPNVATVVLAQMGNRLAEVDTVEKLLPLITVEQTGNLLVINAKANQPDLAAELANNWAKQTEIYINGIYGQVAQQLSEIEIKQAEAYQDYVLKQQALESFITTNHIRALNRQVADLNQIREDLYKRHLSIIDLGLETQFILAKGQSEDYYQTLTDQRLQVRQQQENQARDLFNYYDARQKLLNQYLVGMEALAQQITTQPTTTVSMGDVLAMMQAKVALFGQTGETPANNLNLQLSDATLLANNPAQVTAELKEFIAQIKVEATKTTQQLETLSNTLLKGDNYQYPGMTLDESDPLLSAATSRMKNMTELTGLAKVFPEYAKLPLYQKITELDLQIDQLNGLLESEQAKQKELAGERDLAWEAYQTIQRKTTEIQVSAQAPSSEVRFVTQALPTNRATASRASLNALIALAASLAVTMIAVFAWDWWRETTPTTN